MKILNPSPLWILRQNAFKWAKVLHFQNKVKKAKKLVNPQMLAVRILIKHLDYHKESEDILHQFS